MLRLIYTVSIVGVILSTAATAANYKPISPYAFDRKVEIQVNGQVQEYFALAGDGRVQVKIKGPTRLQVLSRVTLDGQLDSTDYRFLARRKGSSRPIEIQHSSHVLAGVLTGDHARVTANRSRIIDIPRGNQTYSFFLPRNSKQTVFLRFECETNEFAPDEKIVAMTPISYTTRVDLITKEQVSAYYRVGAQDQVTLRLIGPATIKVLSRIEFSLNMTGRQKWRVQILEDGKVRATHVLSGNKSQVTSYREASPYVPSLAQALYLDVPEGTHEYEFRLPDNHRTVLFRFVLPAKQLEKG